MASVTIASLSARPLSVPTFDPFVIASGRVDATRSVLIEVELVDERGRRERGLGEAACLPPVTREDQPDVLRQLVERGPRLSGSAFDGEVFASSSLEQKLDEHLGDCVVARSGVEMALLDALSRLRGVPLCRFLADDDVPTSLESDVTIPILPAERMAELARGWWAKGFHSFKVKVGKDLDADMRALEAVHRAAPLATFRPDANGGFTAAEALAFVRSAEKLGLTLECFEQPCAADDYDGLAEVARNIEAPLIADESVKSLADLERICAREAADGVNLKIAKSGGVLRALGIGRSAKGRGMSLMVGGMVETRLGMTAGVHVALALGGVEFPDLDTAWLLREDPFEGGYEADGPRYTLPVRAGLGIAKVE
jgi:L-alanine-DL-glutamate epimerase-like enolase superfamily enzyme